MLSARQLLPTGSLAVKWVLQLIEILHLKGVSGGEGVLHRKGIFECNVDTFCLCLRSGIDPLTIYDLIWALATNLGSANFS